VCWAADSEVVWGRGVQELEGEVGCGGVSGVLSCEGGVYEGEFEVSGVWELDVV